MAEECVPPNTERRIKEAARKVFMEKGYDGTTSRDIAEAAGINVALTNYYFRSKATLFRMIFEDAHQELFRKSREVLERSTPLREKIQELISTDFELFAGNPSLPLFLLAEWHRHPELLASTTKWHPIVHQFFNEIREAGARGEIRPLEPIHVMQFIMANVQFLYMSRPLTMNITNLDQAGYSDFAERHQQLVTDMILNYLFDF
ncbi:MAG TPA: TetR/AcrR family transcriptional regulator [Hymenobacter sp.]|jgi:AcrR family transcriptional regulator